MSCSVIGCSFWLLCLRTGDGLSSNSSTILLMADSIGTCNITFLNKQGLYGLTSRKPGFWNVGLFRRSGNLNIWKCTQKLTPSSSGVKRCLRKLKQ